MEDGENTSALEPDVMDLSFGTGMGFVTISNFGFSDGKLHIQTKWESSFDNHGDLWLVGKDSSATAAEPEVVHYTTYYFQTDLDLSNSEDNRFAKYIEYVFDVGSLEELSQYDLWATFVEDGTFINGNCQINFRMSDSGRLIIEDTNHLADQVELTSQEPIYTDIGENRNRVD